MSVDVRARINALRARIERISSAPEEVRAPLVRLARPVLRGLGWQPSYRTQALQRLLVCRPKDAEDEGLRALGAALRELSGNITQAERACVLHKRLSAAHTSWLGRQIEVITELSRARTTLWFSDPTVLAALRQRALAPLSVVGAVGRSEADAGDVFRHEGSARVVDFNLGAVDALVEMSRAQGGSSGRRRQLLEAARMQLLDVSAALPLAPEAVSARRRHIAQEIARIDRLHAAGLSPSVSLVHQCKSALARGDRQGLHLCLVAIDEDARRRSDRGVSSRATRAIDRLWAGRDRYAAAERLRSQETSIAEALGAPMLDAMRRAYALGRAHNGFAGPLEGATARLYLAEEGEGATMAAALTAGGLFEVGGGLSAQRVIEREERVRRVRFPTEKMVLADAETVEDLPNAVIEDPRGVLLSLAEGRLLTRKYLRRESVARSRTRMVGEVRVYVLDGSGSMHLGPIGAGFGARARVRDGLLVAELGSLAKRCVELGRSSRVVLYYRYFDHELGRLCKVDSVESAESAIQDVLGTVRQGGTNIERALTESFKLIETERVRDPDLASAQVVLVTDGEAHVDPRVVIGSREAVGGELPVRLSVVALGQENPALRALVAAQRARGEMAFYHYLDDETLGAIVTGVCDLGPCLHVPEATALDSLPESERSRVLQGLVGELVEELSELDVEASERAEEIERSEAEAEARGELGLDGAAAWRAVLKRDRKALERRFSRWFPEGTGELGALAGADVDCALVLLGTVAEVIDVVGGSELARRADAIALIERLLPLSGLTPARYLEVVNAGPKGLAGALAGLHRAVRVGAG